MKDYHEVAENVFRRRDEYESKKTACRQRLHKIATTLSVLAIVITFLFTAGTCYVFAVGLGIVEDTLGIYDKFFAVSITQKQQDAVKSAAVSLGETVTSYGISVTAQSAFTDGSTAYVLLKIVAPEHIDLEDMSAIHFNIDWRGITRGDNPQKQLGAYDGIIKQFNLDDQDGVKNTKEILISFHTLCSPGYSYSLADGYDRYLTLEGLYESEPEFLYAERQISDGKWIFQIRFDDTFSNIEREMLDCPVNLSIRTGMFNDVPQTAIVHSIVVRGLSVDFRYTYIADGVPEPGDLGDVKIVLTDGTIIDLERDLASSEDNGEFITTYSATAPILVEDIDYIQIGETIIPASGSVR